MKTPTLSPLYRLLDTKLQADNRGTLANWVRACRKMSQSWDSIAAEINRITGESVNGETLRTWFTTEETPAP